ncbi:MAG: phosphate signaling complex protein PhoU [Pseudomonadota bacterium]
MKIQGKGHIFKRFDNEMDHLHTLVMDMGSLAIEQLASAAETLASKDPAKAHQVIANDEKLNDLDVQADDEIIRIIALRAPMARDLREIIAVSKIVAELERAGDEARKIAGLTIRFYDNDERPPSGGILDDIFSLTEFVSMMLSDSMEALDDLDLDLAIKILGQGIKLDEKLQSSLRHLSTYIMEDSRNVGHFVDIVLGIRALERFGGHAKNIAGHIVFLTKGIDVRHEDTESVIQKVNAEG